jgi:hypothetical protein
VVAEQAHEVLVRAYLRTLPFLWLAVDDPPGRTSHRAIIERGAIGLLSRRVNPQADPPSPKWLGLHAVAPEISTSGLWNVNHVDEPHDPASSESSNRIWRRRRRSRAGATRAVASRRSPKRWPAVG